MYKIKKSREQTKQEELHVQSLVIWKPVARDFGVLGTGSTATGTMKLLRVTLFRSVKRRQFQRSLTKVCEGAADLHVLAIKGRASTRIGLAFPL